MRAPDPEAMLSDLPDWKWKRWQAWMKVRGPIGGVRDDNYITYLALHSRRAIGNKDGSVESEHFLLPWMEPVDPEPVENDPFDVYDPKRDGEVYL